MNIKWWSRSNYRQHLCYS